MAISGFLKEVVEKKKIDVAEAQRLLPLNSIREQAEKRLKNTLSSDYRHPFLFLRSLEKSRIGNVGIIAEIKKASPSKGDIKPDLNPSEYAEKYTKAGACAISVLTEKHYFKGSIDDLKAVRSSTSLPILRKDFILSSYQIYEAKAAGADSVLLIAAMLSKEQLRDYAALSRELKIEPLVEINSEWEIDKTLFADSKIIGINNRNLQTLEVDLNVSKRVVPFLTQNQIIVEASGISCSKDIQKGLDCNIFNFLVGESIVRAENTQEFIQSLVKTRIEDNFIKNDNFINNLADDKKRVFVKICGLTTFQEASACADAGADAVGFIFYPKSPRYITPEAAAEITRKLPDRIMTTGVFVDENYKSIMQVVKECSLKAVQLHGNETPLLVKQLSEQGLIVIKALFAGRDPYLTDAHLYNDAYAILVEYGKGELPGGNGGSWNWELAADITKTSGKKNSIKDSISDSESREVNEKEIKIILAGGINPENIQKAIKMAKPWGVDISSGVEFVPGKKDINKVKNIIEQIAE